VTSANAPASAAPATATLVVDRLPAPTVTKAFAPTPIFIGQTSVLTITLTNANAQAINGAPSPNLSGERGQRGGAERGNHLRWDGDGEAAGAPRSPASTARSPPTAVARFR
jgi:hypothetical protein